MEDGVVVVVPYKIEYVGKMPGRIFIYLRRQVWFASIAKITEKRCLVYYTIQIGKINVSISRFTW